MAIDFRGPLFLEPSPKSGKKRRENWRGSSPAVERSARLYVYIDPSQVHLFRFFLEGHDNLGIMTVVDRWRAALLLRFSPHQQQEVREFLDAVREVLPLGLAYIP